MKIKLLMAGFLSLVSATTFAQTKELTSAQTNYEKYTSLRTQKTGPFAATAKTSITDAKTSIDKASVNEKTSVLPLTFALKGAIYSALAVDDTVATTSAPLFATADEAVKKAKEMDTKGENKKLIDEANLNLAQYKLTEGVKDYQNAKFEDAYKALDYYRTILPDDTNAVYYTALSATNAGNKDPKYYPLAISNFNKLITLKYSGNEKVYLTLSSLYLTVKDTANALKTTTDGIAKYPKDGDLRRREIEISLQTGKQKEVLNKIESAIATDPKNKTLYYYAGLTYTQLADEADGESVKAKDAATKTSKHATALEYYGKAYDYCKKALEIDPEYFEANLNAGYDLEKPAIDDYNTANKLPATQQKEFDALIAKANGEFEASKPFLQKAVDLNPKSVEALGNLRNYYRGKSDKAHSAENTAKANDIKKQIDALQ
jgi:hypothetical protein